MRRPPNSPPGNLDALLNTLTNALGIFLILLAVTQLGVDEAVDHIEQRTEVRSNTQAEKMAKDIADSQAALVKMREQVRLAQAALPDIRNTLKTQHKQIAAIRTELIEGKENTRLAETKRRFDDLSKTVANLETKVAQATKETADLTARVENAPSVAKQPDALLVSLPNPRPAAANLNPVELVCRHGRVIPYNETALLKIAKEHVSRALNELIKPEGIDCNRLQELFENDEVGNAFFRLKIARDGKVPELVATDRDNVGETAETIASTTSLFHDIVRSVDRRNEWIRFRVYPDSFEVYFAAREIAARRNLSVGWQPCESDSQQHISLKLAAGTRCIGYETPSAAPAKIEAPKMEPPKAAVPEPEPQDSAQATSKSIRIRLPNQRNDPDSPDAVPNLDTKIKRKGPVSREERALWKEQRKAEKAAQGKLKEKPQPAAEPEPAAKEAPKPTPPPQTEPAKPVAQSAKSAAELAKPAEPAFPNDDID